MEDIARDFATNNFRIEDEKEHREITQLLLKFGEIYLKNKI